MGRIFEYNTLTHTPLQMKKLSCMDSATTTLMRYGSTVREIMYHNISYSYNANDNKKSIKITVWSVFKVNYRRYGTIKKGD